MKSMLPEGAVRQKLTGDGYAARDIEAFLSGQVPYITLPALGASAAPPRPPLAAMLAQQPTLRAAPPPAPAAPAKPNPRMSLLEEIAQGPKLRAVNREDSRSKAPEAKITGGGGILGMLAMEMSKRRFNMNQQEDSDSDSGFSDSDSDSD